MLPPPSLLPLGAGGGTERAAEAREEGLGWEGGREARGAAGKGSHGDCGAGGDGSQRLREKWRGSKQIQAFVYCGCGEISSALWCTESLKIAALLSTVGSHLADKLGWKFYDGDDYHPDENKKKMAEGIPLNDQDPMALPSS
ncbi:probable gluconokinase isoform X3 [Sceloporus undulatus]|uniref:probable gluconokinase isoform X3 n=1 Tax=Sceloporus undulatus TaxID=8520 RepID=UPI001C4B5970|nr:probable gluconokinase isoform X3 [Sceloporus undulatus]